MAKFQIPGLTGSSESFTSLGKVYMSGRFHKAELSIEDINGGSFFVEVGLGAAWGGAAYAMVFGMNTAQFLRAMITPAGFNPYTEDTSTGMLIFGGANFGFQAGGGITSFAGVLTTQ